MSASTLGSLGDPVAQFAECHYVSCRHSTQAAWQTNLANSI